MLSVHNLGSSYFCFLLGSLEEGEFYRLKKTRGTVETSLYTTAFIFWDTLI